MLRLSLAFVVALVACNKDGSGTPSPDLAPRPDPFKPVPECEPGTLLVRPTQGDRRLLLGSLKIGSLADGFDLNGDGIADNKLSPLGAAANGPIAETFQTDRSIIIPVEMFGYKGQDSTCTKVAFYIGRLNDDKDGDGRDVSWQAGKADCDDTNADVSPRATENTTNRVDDDCDGYADNATRGIPPDDTQDLDGDGKSLKDGDCDDRAGSELAKRRFPGAAEVCDNGIDDDCDGIPDNGAACDPFRNYKGAVHLQAVSFASPTGDGGILGIPDGGVVDVPSLKPLIVFPDGKVQNKVLTAGPDLFALGVPFGNSPSDVVNLTITGARLEFQLEERGGDTFVTSGRLGGVLDAATLSQVKGLDAGGILKKEQSLLDAIFVGPAATILGLASDREQHYLPDIDVDGDGLETFWQEATVSPDGGATTIAVVDTCKDGDGTIVKNNWDGKGSSCALAVDPKTGKLRFVDGLSVALRFTAVPTTFIDVVEK